MRVSVASSGLKARMKSCVYGVLLVARMVCAGFLSLRRDYTSTYSGAYDWCFIWDGRSRGGCMGVLVCTFMVLEPP